MNHFRSALIVCWLLLGLSFISAEAKDKVPESRVEIAHREKPHCQSLEQAAVAAFATISGRIRFDRPLFVATWKTNHSFVVEFFSIPAHESGNSLSTRTNKNRRLAIVKIDEDISFETSTNEVAVARSFAHDSVLAAVAVLGARCSLPSAFEINSTMKINECRVHIAHYPLTPDAESIVMVSKSSVRVY